jgi:CDGSH-type Zn-finger protein
MSENTPLEITGEDEILVCVCMQSNHWPFCDASHHSLAGSEIEPRMVKLDKTKTYHLCRCYRTKTAPFCDGSHKKIAARDA